MGRSMHTVNIPVLVAPLIQSHGLIITRRTLLHYTGEVQDVRDRLFAAIKAHLYLSELMRAWFYFSYMEAKSLSCCLDG